MALDTERTPPILIDPPTGTTRPCLEVILLYSSIREGVCSEVILYPLLSLIKIAEESPMFAIVNLQSLTQAMRQVVPS